MAKTKYSKKKVVNPVTRLIYGDTIKKMKMGDLFKVNLEPEKILKGKPFIKKVKK
jgi:hypothetical protein